MKTTAILAALVLVGVAVAPLVSAGHQVQGDYLMGATPGLSVTACSGAVGCTGGHIFTADVIGGHTPTGVIISDASGGDVHFTAAQDFDGNNISGEEGEPRVDGCGSSANFADSQVPFSGGFGVAVFIRIWHPDCPATVATSGTVTVTTA